MIMFLLALVHLNKLQIARISIEKGAVPPPIKDSSLIKALITGYAKETAARKRDSFQDRGIGGPSDGYTGEDLRRMSTYWLSRAEEGCKTSIRIFAERMISHT